MKHSGPLLHEIGSTPPAEQRPDPPGPLPRSPVGVPRHFWQGLRYGPKLTRGWRKP